MLASAARLTTECVNGARLTTEFGTGEVHQVRKPLSKKEAAVRLKQQKRHRRITSNVRVI